MRSPAKRKQVLCALAFFRMARKPSVCPCGKISFIWVRENTLIQLTSISSKVINEEICLATTYSSSICYLTADLDVEFPEHVLSQDDSSTKLITTPVIASVKVDSYWTCKTCQRRLARREQIFIKKRFTVSF